MALEVEHHGTWQVWDYDKPGEHWAFVERELKGGDDEYEN